MYEHAEHAFAMSGGSSLTLEANANTTAPIIETESLYNCRLSGDPRFHRKQQKMDTGERKLLVRNPQKK